MLAVRVPASFSGHTRAEYTRADRGIPIRMGLIVAVVHSTSRLKLSTALQCVVCALGQLSSLGGDRVRLGLGACCLWVLLSSTCSGLKLLSAL